MRRPRGIPVAALTIDAFPLSANDGVISNERNDSFGTEGRDQDGTEYPTKVPKRPAATREEPVERRGMGFRKNGKTPLNVAKGSSTDGQYRPQDYDLKHAESRLRKRRFKRGE